MENILLPLRYVYHNRGIPMLHLPHTIRYDNYISASTVHLPSEVPTVLHLPYSYCQGRVDIKVPTDVMEIQLDSWHSSSWCMVDVAH